MAYYVCGLAEGNSYMALSVIWVLPRIVGLGEGAVVGLQGTLPTLFERLPFVANAKVTKTLAKYLDNVRIGDGLNCIPVVGVVWCNGEVGEACYRALKYDYWGSESWTAYLIVEQGEFNTAIFKSAPSLTDWVKDAFKSRSSFEIIQVGYESAKWKDEPKVWIAGKSRTTLNNFIFYLEDGYVDQGSAPQTRVQRRTPLDVVDLDEPLLFAEA